MDAEYQYLVGKLQEALATDPRVNALDIKVMIFGGKVHLTGQIPTAARRDAVLAGVTEAAPGVEVYNELTVLELSPGIPSEVIHD